MAQLESVLELAAVDMSEENRPVHNALEKQLS